MLSATGCSYPWKKNTSFGIRTTDGPLKTAKYQLESFKQDSTSSLSALSTLVEYYFIRLSKALGILLSNLTIWRFIDGLSLDSILQLGRTVESPCDGFTSQRVYYPDVA